MEKLKLYLDNCCYNRPFDDLKSERIRRESQAVEQIIERYILKKVEIYKSKVLDFEINNISQGIKKRQIEDLYDMLDLKNIPYKYELDKRVKDLEKMNIHYMDAYHIAYAESMNLDYFITVDKQLINASNNTNVRIKVINPIDFIMEVI